MKAGFSSPVLSDVPAPHLFSEQLRDRFLKRLLKVVSYLVLSVAAILLFVPLVWMVLCAFTPQAELQRQVPMSGTFAALDLHTLTHPRAFVKWVDDSFTTRNFRSEDDRNGLYDITSMSRGDFLEAPVHRWAVHGWRAVAGFFGVSESRTSPDASRPVLAGRLILWFENTLFIAAMVTLLSVVLNSMAGYAFAKIPFPGSKVLFWLVIATIMIPGQVTVIPLFLLFTRGLRWYDSFWAVILPQVAAPVGIFLMRQYIQALPSTLEEAARIDGCSEPGIFMRVIVPLSKPILSVWAIFTFIGAWKAFLWPLIITDDQNMFMLEVGLKTLQFSAGPRNVGIVMSAALLASIPMVLIFFMYQKHLTRGLTVGAVKG